MSKTVRLEKFQILNFSKQMVFDLESVRVLLKDDFTIPEMPVAEPSLVDFDFDMQILPFPNTKLTEPAPNLENYKRLNHALKPINDKLCYLQSFSERVKHVKFDRN